jgi:phosphatidate cytidylyltransferase
VGSDLRRRILFALPLIAFAIFIVYEGGVVFAVGVAALALLCMDELCRLLERAHPVRLAGFLGIIGLIAAANWGGQYQVLLAAAIALPVTFLLTLAAPRGGLLSIAVIMLGLWWIGFGVAHAVLLRGLPHGGGVVVDVLVGTFIGDTGAYLGGRWFGKRPLAPRISPNKTLEGLLIGMAAAVLGVWFASLYQDWMHKGNAVLLGIGVALAGPLGDLFESYVKRESGKKDAGTIFGPHGGVLDRLDAVLFTVVAGYYIWHAIIL